MTENNFDVLNSAMETVEDVESLLVNPSSEETLLDTDFHTDNTLALTDDELIVAPLAVVPLLKFTVIFFVGFDIFTLLSYVADVGCEEP